MINEAGQKIGRGYEFERERQIELPNGPEGAPAEFSWRERLLVIRSESLLKAQAAGLAKRLSNGIQELKALTPEPGRGRRQYRDEESFQEAVNQVIEKHRLAGLLEVEWKIDEQRKMRFVGRGRGALIASNKRPSHAGFRSRTSSARKARWPRIASDWADVRN